jgi:hypothetical protein
MLGDAAYDSGELREQLDERGTLGTIGFASTPTNCAQVLTELCLVSGRDAGLHVIDVTDQQRDQLALAQSRLPISLRAADEAADEGSDYGQS